MTEPVNARVGVMQPATEVHMPLVDVPLPRQTQTLFLGSLW
jgi:hypothetical protein